MIEAAAGRLKKRFAERGSRTEGAVTCERERKLKTGLCVQTKWERQRVLWMDEDEKYWTEK